MKKKISLILAVVFCLTSILVATSCGNKNKTNTDTNSNTTSNTLTNTDTSTTNTGSENTGSVNTDTENTETSTSTNTNTCSSQPPVEENTTYEEFLSEYSIIANQFALDQIEQISYNENALSTSYSFVANEDKLEKIIVAQVVAGEGTQRELKIDKISFADGVDFDDIVSGENELVPVITSETVLTFDAKEEYKKGDSSTITQQIADKIAENLGDNAIEVEEYKAETFAPATVKELADEYATTVNEVLNKNFKQKIIDKCFIGGFDETKLVDAQWVLEGETEVTGVKWIIDYRTTETETASMVRVISIEFESSISSLDSLITVSSEIEGSKPVSEYSFGYNPTIQGTRDELMNAIFKANGMSETCPEGAVRLIKVGSSGPDALGYQCTGFTVVEIGNDKITEFSMAIKLSSTDAQYITNIQNGYYRFYGEKSADISGEEVEYSPLEESE